jgi:DNA repair exonuclease SbcCD nuclease subunit
MGLAARGGKGRVVDHLSKKPIKILHTADIHLDCDSFGNPEQRQAQRALFFRTFQTIVERAIDERVDLMLIAGDLFDHNRVPDETLAFVQDQLQRLQQPVVILPGNHDCLYTGSIYDRYDFSAAGDHVHVITELNGQTVELPELDAVVWGRAMEEHEPGFHPLGPIPSRLDQRWHLAMAHGFFYDSAQDADRSSPIFAEEIRDTGWDYVAMGHVHVMADRSQGDVTAYYPGASLVHWSGAAPNGGVLLIDCSPEQGIVVRPQPVF